MRTFQILVDNSQRVYTSGDIVKGQVVLRSDDDEAVGSVTIFFEGRGKTKLRRYNGNNRRTYRGRAPLFILRKVLYRGHYTLRADRYSWPFEFTFPSNSNPSSVEDTFRNDGRFLTVGQIHPLPPSFNSYDDGSNDQGMVEYKLEARLERPADTPIFSSGHLEHAVELRYLPLRSVLEPKFNMFGIEKSYIARTLKLLPEKQDLTMKEKLHSLFKSDDLPSASFRLRCEYPTQTFAGRQLPIKLSVVALSTSDEVPSPPTIYLHNITVEIKAEYAFRAVSLLSDRYGNVTERYTLLDASNIDVPIPFDQTAEMVQTECLDLNKVKSGGLVTPALCPGFSTYNVAVGYRLKIKAKVVSAGKNFDLEVFARLNVLSSLSESQGQPVQSSSSAQHVVPTLAPEEPPSELPPYTRNAGPEQEMLNGEMSELPGPSEPLPRYQPPGAVSSPPGVSEKGREDS
jgi:Arrestin (or S-antigen), N-terminal domain